jgi:nitrile hydratase accessory protein
MHCVDAASSADRPDDPDAAVFRAPWEAQVFALMVKLQREGVFSAEEWARQLGAAIEAARRAGDPDLGNTYYLHWLSALEDLVIAKGLATRELLAERHAGAYAAYLALHADAPEHGDRDDDHDHVQ